ncbi:MAG: FHA domain-containing protein [Gammaproteobacteria bacterium]
MLDKFFTKPLELEIDGTILKFNSEADFEFSMAGRTAIPSTKISDLLKLSMEQLKDEEEAVANSKDSFFSILSQTIEDPETIDRAMRELDTLIFSQDHNWRDIIKVLNENDEKFNPLRTIALSKYLKYLTALQETIGYIRVEKETSLESTSAEGKSQNPEFGATWSPVHLPTGSVTSEQKEDEFERLPKGEAVKIMVIPGTKLDMKLSEYKCQLVASGDKIVFIDQSGKKTVLRKGRNIIGRGADSIVKIDAALREVSRTHALIYNEDHQIIQLTDLSSGGTFISGKELKRHIS